MIVGLKDIIKHLESNHVEHGAYASKEIIDKNENESILTIRSLR